MIEIVAVTECEACGDDVCDCVKSGESEAVSDDTAEPLTDGCLDDDTVELASGEVDTRMEGECSSVREVETDRLAAADDDADIVSDCV